MSIQAFSCLEKCFYSSSTWEKVKVYHKDYEEPFIDTLDNRDGTLFKNEHWFVISGKGFGLSLVLPLIHVATVAINILRMVVFPFLISYNNYTSGKKISFLENCKQIIQAEATCLRRIILSPLYCLSLQFAAVYTIFFPNEGRKVFSSIEKSWCDNLPTDKDIRIVTDEDKENEDKHYFNAFFDYKNEYCFYSAYCFQPVGNISDEKFTHYESDS